MKKQTAASSLAVETAFPAAQTEYNIKKTPFSKTFLWVPLHPFALSTQNKINKKGNFEISGNAVSKLLRESGFPTVLMGNGAFGA
jgi:hypothetical protein